MIMWAQRSSKKETTTTIITKAGLIFSGQNWEEDRGESLKWKAQFSLEIYPWNMFQLYAKWKFGRIKMQADKVQRNI